MPREVDNAWVTNDELGELYATAEAMGASSFVLSNEVRTRKYVETKYKAAAQAGDLVFLIASIDYNEKVNDFIL